MTLTEEIAELQREMPAAVEHERLVQDAAFLHSARFPFNESIAGYPAAPLSLFHCNVLRMMGSPFLSPFKTPGPGELAAFLWVVHPEFIPGHGKAAVRRRNAFFKTCRKFVQPAQPVLGTTWAMQRWEKRAGEALDIFTRTLTAAREYVAEAMQDKPVANGEAGGPDYYSDFCHIAAALMRNYPGMDYERIQFMPAKVVYQFLKEIRERSAAEVGEPALLWNASDDISDRILELINKKN